MGMWEMDAQKHPKTLLEYRSPPPFSVSFIAILTIETLLCTFIYSPVLEQQVLA